MNLQWLACWTDPKLTHLQASSSRQSGKKASWMNEILKICLKLGNQQEQIGRLQSDLLLAKAKTTVIFVQIHDDLVAHKQTQLQCFGRNFGCCKFAYNSQKINSSQSVQRNIPDMAINSISCISMLRMWVTTLVIRNWMALWNILI